MLALVLLFMLILAPRSSVQTLNRFLGIWILFCSFWCLLHAFSICTPLATAPVLVWPQTLQETTMILMIHTTR